jgi:hypothetical protein
MSRLANPQGNAYDDTRREALHFFEVADYYMTIAQGLSEAGHAHQQVLAMYQVAMNATALASSLQDFLKASAEPPALRVPNVPPDLFSQDRPSDMSVGRS